MIMLPQSTDELNDIESVLPSETAGYLNHIESKLYADIAARKRIDSGLLFLACQLAIIQSTSHIVNNSISKFLCKLFAGIN
jgi:hypothetical protein